MSFSPGGNTLASGSSDNTIRLWDAKTEQHLNTLEGHTSGVSSVTFSPDGNTLASGSWQEIRLWDVNTGNNIRTLEGHTGRVTSVSFSPDGSTLASGSWDGTVLLWTLTPTMDTETPSLTEDVNNDGVVDVQDIIYVAQRYGQTGQDAADVNEDGVVNIDDIVLVAAAIDSAPSAPSIRSQTPKDLTAAKVSGWLAEAKLIGNQTAIYQRGILTLEQLLAALTPQETALLPNYPNPFNPETWIPYQLSQDATVTLTIYDTQGVMVRQLALGYQQAGFYTDRTKAAYWDGRNDMGEQVASGVYVYHLKAGDYSAMRKMVILK